MPAGQRGSWVLSQILRVGPLTEVDVAEGSAPDLATEAVFVPHTELESA